MDTLAFPLDPAVNDKMTKNNTTRTIEGSLLVPNQHRVSPGAACDPVLFLAVHFTWKFVTWYSLLLPYEW